MCADFVTIRPVGDDPVMAQHGAEVSKRRGSVIVSPLPLAQWVAHSSEVREGDLVYPEGGDGRVREGSDLPVLGEGIRHVNSPLLPGPVCGGEI